MIENDGVDYPNKLIRRSVFPIGVQTLWYGKYGSWWVRCMNRTYDSGFIRINPIKVPYWMEALDELPEHPTRG